MRKRILVLSDNHGDLNIMQQIINTTSHDLAIHAGDYGLDPTIMEQMFDYYVDGNNDFGDKQIVTFTYEKIKFLLLHGDQVYSFNKAKWKQRLIDLASKYQANVIIYGHSHLEEINQQSDITILNPGSIALPRNAQRRKSYILIDIENNKIIPQIKYW